MAGSGCASRLHSLGMRFGLVVVSASRSRPYPKAAGGGCERQTAACLLVSPGCGRSADACARHCRRLGPRHGTVTRLGRDPQHQRCSPPRASRSGARGRGRIIPMDRSASIRGLGPGRGQFGREAPQTSVGGLDLDTAFRPKSPTHLNIQLLGTKLHVPRGGKPRPRSSVQVTRLGPRVAVTALPRIGSSAGFQGASEKVSSRRMTAIFPVGVEMARS